MPSKIYHTQQDDVINLYLLYCDGHLDAVYTNKVQAESDIRRAEGGNYSLREMQTIPADNFR